MKKNFTAASHRCYMFSTLGGTSLVLLALNSQAILETVALAALGAAVSFSVSIALKSLLRW